MTTMVENHRSWLYQDVPGENEQLSGPATVVEAQAVQDVLDPSDGAWWDRRIHELLDDQTEFLPDDYEPISGAAVELYRQVMTGLDTTGFNQQFAVFATAEGGLRLQLKLGRWLHSVLLHEEGSTYYIVPRSGVGARHYDSHNARDLVAAFGYALGHVA